MRNEQLIAVAGNDTKVDLRPKPEALGYDEPRAITAQSDERRTAMHATFQKECGGNCDAHANNKRREYPPERYAVVNALAQFLC